MNDKINELLERVEAFKPKAAAEIEDFRIRMLGKKGELTALMEEFKSVAPELKREFGQKLNNLKNRTQERINALRGQLADAAGDSSQRIPDMSRPGSAEELGSRHPISLVTNQIVEVFSRLGYTVAEGPEIEDDWHVFSALNFPPEHPARDMQDTFFIAKNPDVLLRTHTSSIQVRTMERQKPPIRVICPGRVFRNEAISYRAHCIFHQIEGLYIDEGVSFADLKPSILYFAKEVFGENATIRMRPSYFPFTEPSAEVDVSCNLCGGKGCNVCKGTGWLEIMGCGMVDPNVLEANGIDSKKYSGFAFGMGVERIAMLKYGVTPDIVCLAKAFGGGMPLGAFVSRPEIMQTLQENPVLGHITTFGGHPVCCATGLAALEYLLETGTVEHVEGRGVLYESLLADHPQVVEIRRSGLLLAVELGSSAKMFRMMELFKEAGILSDWFLYCDTAFRISPPLTITEEEVRDSARLIRECLDRI